MYLNPYKIKEMGEICLLRYMIIFIFQSLVAERSSSFLLVATQRVQKDKSDSKPYLAIQTAEFASVGVAIFSRDERLASSNPASPGRLYF